MTTQRSTFSQRFIGFVDAISRWLLMGVCVMMLNFYVFMKQVPADLKLLKGEMVEHVAKEIAKLPPGIFVARVDAIERKVDTNTDILTDIRIEMSAQTARMAAIESLIRNDR